jgi:hypothetical protein
MIDITVIETGVDIEGKLFYLDTEEEIIIAITEIINKAKYSGESIRLYGLINSQEKECREQW